MTDRHGRTTSARGGNAADRHNPAYSPAAVYFFDFYRQGLQLFAALVRLTIRNNFKQHIMKTITGAFILLASLSACVTGNAGQRDKTMTTRTVSIADFNGIDTSSGITVVYSQGELSAARITAPRYIFDYLEIEVDQKGTLELSISSRYWKKYNSMNGEITVTVSSPRINRLEASSGSSIKSVGALRANGKADIETSSGASITLPGGFTATGKTEIEVESGSAVSITGLNAPQIDADLSSGSQLTLTNATATHASFDLSSGASCTVAGKTSSLKVDASSGSSFNGKKFIADKADIDASSGATVDYNAAKANADAGVTGSAHNYR